MKRLAVMLTLLMLSLVPAAAATPAAVGPTTPTTAQTFAATCQPDNIWGFCFDTLPKLWCCSAAFLGWSEIHVGDRFPVSGRVALAQERAGQQVVIRFPSGREVEIPVDGQGAFREVISFDEEGAYRLLVHEGLETAAFSVAYRAAFVDLPTVEQVFGKHHRRSAVTIGVVESGRPTEIAIRFTGPGGEPVRNQTLAFGFGDVRYHTDADGVARLTYREDNPSGYAISRLYPGLGVITYRTVHLDSEGRLTGLPGGPVESVTRDGRWYLPLRESLEKAAPWRLGDLPERIEWDDATRSIRFAGLTLMVDTGLVLGSQDFRIDLLNLEGRNYVAFDSLIELLDRIGMAARTGEGTFSLSMAEEP